MVMDRLPEWATLLPPPLGLPDRVSWAPLKPQDQWAEPALPAQEVSAPHLIIAVVQWEQGSPWLQERSLLQLLPPNHPQTPTPDHFARESTWQR